MEKKLTDEVVVAKNAITDEGIVKELINESNRGAWCELSFIDCVEVRVLKNALDLINRQKAEIERLTEENEYLDGCAKQFLADYQKFEVELSEQEDKCLDCPYQLKFNEIERQAVKDTAKEIYHLIDMFPIPTRKGQQRYATGFENGLTAIKLKIAERYGVEVE